MKVSTPVPGSSRIAGAVQISLSGLDVADGVSKKSAPEDRQLGEILSKDEESKPLSDERYRKLREDVEKNSGLLRFLNERLRFSLHEGTRRLQVSILDGTTDEIIKKIPPDELLNVIARLREMKGILIDEKK